jgi:hypothetical protein
LRRYNEATQEQREHIEVLQKPKDLEAHIPDVQVTASTVNFMQHAT